MIYQLMKRDLAWKGMPLAAIASAVVWAWASPIEAFAPMVVIMALFTAFPYRRATRFEAALPIAGRHLIAARTLSILALIWIPSIIGLAAAVVVRGSAPHALTNMAVAGLCTLIAGVAQWARLPLNAAPQWIPYSLFGVLWVLLAIPLFGDRFVGPLAAASAMAGIALLTRAWQTAPASFQFAPAECSDADRLPHRALPVQERAGSFVWAPVMRSVYTWQFLFFTGITGVQTLDGQWLASVLWLAFAWQAAKLRTRWLWGLPIGRRALLWTLMGPVLAVEALAYLAGFFLHRRLAPISGPRTVAVTLGAMLIWAMLAILLNTLYDWRKLCRLSQGTRATVLLLPFGAVFLAHIALPFDEQARVRDALARLAQGVPIGFPALVAWVAALLFAVYWMTEKVFSEPEFADKPKAQATE